MRIEIKIIGGKWLINEKPYSMCDWIEKVFFDNYFFLKRMDSQIKKAS